MKHSDVHQMFHPFIHSSSARSLLPEFREDPRVCHKGLLRRGQGRVALSMTSLLPTMLTRELGNGREVGHRRENPWLSVAWCGEPCDAEAMDRRDDMF